jgi:hypothetical protein
MGPVRTIRDHGNSGFVVNCRADPSWVVQARDIHRLQGFRRTNMKNLLRHGLALLLAGVASLGLLGGVASLADGDRARLAQARQAQAVLAAARPVAQPQ